MKILFMGTPGFAAEALEKIIAAGFSVAGAVSQPDRPKGRGHKLTPTDVKVKATEHNIPVYQPEKIRNGELLPVLDEVKPDIIVVAAYGKILPEYILNYPKYGCINIHASLLPKYRGAAPIQWAIVNGEKVTGVTIMQMAKGLDTGDMLLKRETEIGEYETAEELFSRLAVIGGEAAVEALAEIERGGITPERQKDSDSTYAPLIRKETGLIDWTRSSREIFNLVRGMNSWPLAWTKYKNEPLKIIAAEYTDEDTGEKAGKILALEKGRGLKVACGAGTLYIKTAQFPNSKRMDVEDYARGHRIEIGGML